MYSSFCIDFRFISVYIKKLEIVSQGSSFEKQVFRNAWRNVIFSNNLDVQNILQSPNFQNFSPSQKIIMPTPPPPFKNNYVSIIIILLKVFKGISNKLQFSHKLLKHYKECHTYDSLILFFSTVLKIKNNLKILHFKP